MEQTLEKEVLEEEKKSQHSIFETELFKEIFKGVKDVEGELRQELKDVLLSGMKDFVKKEITNTESINEEALELAFFAGIATVLGGDVCGSMRHKEDLKQRQLKELSVKKI